MKILLVDGVVMVALDRKEAAALRRLLYTAVYAGALPVDTMAGLPAAEMIRQIDICLETPP